MHKIENDDDTLFLIRIPSSEGSWIAGPCHELLQLVHEKTAMIMTMEKSWNLGLRLSLSCQKTVQLRHWLQSKTPALASLNYSPFGHGRLRVFISSHRCHLGFKLTPPRHVFWNFHLGTIPVLALTGMSPREHSRVDSRELQPCLSAHSTIARSGLAAALAQPAT